METIKKSLAVLIISTLPMMGHSTMSTVDCLADAYKKCVKDHGLNSQASKNCRKKALSRCGLSIKL